jgi:hypothetical protein
VTDSDALALVAWLREQVDLDEAIARDVEGPGTWTCPSTGVLDLGPDDNWEGMESLVLAPRGVVYHAAHHDPARVLREVASKRSLIFGMEMLLTKSPLDGIPADDPRRLLLGSPLVAKFFEVWAEDSADVAVTVLKALAGVYSDRPGFREEWRS